MHTPQVEPILCNKRWGVAPFGLIVISFISFVNIMNTIQAIVINDAHKTQISKLSKISSCTSIYLYFDCLNRKVC